MCYHRTPPPMERTILHCDLNNFYASVECMQHPAYKSLPLAVCGDAELRHGIVLAKNYPAKAFGIKTGDVIWEAKQKCPDLVVVSANFPLYLRFSKLVRKIYERYTDQIEAFGIDECWLDVTHSTIFGTGEQIAEQIRKSIKEELGLTASIGVSWNKIFAKLGSDMKKPDATTVISKDNYKDTVWRLPVEDLLYVGKATKSKLHKYMIYTIGDLAHADVDFLRLRLGKWGEYLWSFARGLDASTVKQNGEEALVKSVGNSTTAIRDLETAEDVEMIVTVLSESVAARLKEQWLKGQVVSLYLRDSELKSWGMQQKITQPTFLSKDIIEAAMRLFARYPFRIPIRSVGVKVSELCSADTPIQTEIFASEEQKIKREKAEIAVESLRRRFGHFSISRGTEYLDRQLTGFNPKAENVIHPYSFFRK